MVGKGTLRTKEEKARIVMEVCYGSMSGGLSHRQKVDVRSDKSRRNFWAKLIDDQESKNIKERNEYERTKGRKNCRDRLLIIFYICP